MRFTKMHGTGNDFIMVEAAGLNRDWAQTAKAMCERHTGVGADGLILVLPSNSADVRMKIFNADGSEAEMCGNGIRCIAKYAVFRGLVKPGTEQISVETMSGTRMIKLYYEKGEPAQIRVGMGKPRFKASEIPLKIYGEQLDIIQDYPISIGRKKLIVSFVSMGNPHAVHFTDKSIADFPLIELGPKVENHRIFPQRINFEIARVLSRERIEVRVWERGAGETMACGTGACAVAVSARLHGYTGDNVDIMLPGGVLRVQWDGKGEVLMSGPADMVFTGDWLKD